jgi:SulP family sulfate permease
MASQAPDFLGIRAETPAPREFVHRVGWLWENLGTANVATLLLALAAGALIYGWPRLGLKRIPGSIVAMLVVTAVVVLFGMKDVWGVATVGSRFGASAIPEGLPPFAWPNLSLQRIGELMAPATTIAVLGAIESLLSAVVADGLADDRHDSNTELIAQGVANIVCPFFCGLPATGAIARTSANVNNGGRSPLAGIVHTATLLAIVLAAAPLAQYVPLAAIAAVLVMVAFRMGEWHELARLRKMPGSDALVLVTTFALTVVFDLVVAVEVGMVLAAILFIRRIANTTEIAQVTSADELETPEQVMHGKEIPPGVLVYRIFGPFFFGAAEKMEDALLRVQRLPKILILRMQLVPAMDATALNALESVVERIQAKGGTVILSGPHRQPLEMMRTAGFVEKVGRPNIRANFDQALARAREILAAPKTAPAGAEGG